MFDEMSLAGATSAHLERADSVSKTTWRHTEAMPTCGREWRSFTPWGKQYWDRVRRGVEDNESPLSDDEREILKSTRRAGADLGNQTDAPATARQNKADQNERTEAFREQVQDLQFEEGQRSGRPSRSTHPRSTTWTRSTASGPSLAWIAASRTRSPRR